MLETETSGACARGDAVRSECVLQWTCCTPNGLVSDFVTTTKTITKITVSFIEKAGFRTRDLYVLHFLCGSTVLVGFRSNANAFENDEI